MGTRDGREGALGSPPQISARRHTGSKTRILVPWVTCQDIRCGIKWVILRHGLRRYTCSGTTPALLSSIGTYSIHQMADQPHILHWRAAWHGIHAPQEHLAVTLHALKKARDLGFNNGLVGIDERWRMYFTV